MSEIDYHRAEFEKLHCQNPGVRDGDGYFNWQDDCAWSVWKDAIDTHASAASDGAKL